MATTTAENKTVDVVTIAYAELIAFRQDRDQDQDRNRKDRQPLLNKIRDAYGPDGLGILVVTDIPGFDACRQRLLPLARRIATLPPEELSGIVRPETMYSVGWSHGKETYAPGKPDYAKGSFYANPLTDDLVQSLIERDIEHRPRDDSESADDRRKRIRDHWTEQGRLYPEFYAPNAFPDEAAVPGLRAAFMEAGQIMADVGRELAGLCDAYCNTLAIKDCDGFDTIMKVRLNLADTLTRSMNPKGRLLHYFAMDEQQQQESNETTDNGGNDTEPAMWCGWHNDHGSLTALMPSMYLDKDGDPVEDLGADDASGLYVQSRSGEVVRVRFPSGRDACGFQIGEASQIQSGGALRATPHAVLRGGASTRRRPGATRESFALFMEPEFGDVLRVPEGRTVEDCQDFSNSNSNNDTAPSFPASIVPLSARWKPGQTFGEFHKATVSAFTA